MKAVILAGGKSTRLRPLTWELPKPLVPVMNVPVMDNILSLLKKHHITQVCITLMFMPLRIMERYGNGATFGMDIVWNTEERPLGTAGSVKDTGDFVNDTFLVISGDCMTDFDLSAAISYHKAQHAEATILMSKVDVPIDFGVLITDKAGNITGFQEKPNWNEVFTNQVNTGIYIFEPSVLSYIPTSKPFDFSRDLFPQMLQQGKKLCGFEAPGYWSDIGSLDSYAKTHIDIFQRKMQISLSGKEIEPGIYVGSNTIIDPSAEIHAPCLIGDSCHIGPGVVVNSMTCIGNHVVLEEDVVVSNSIIWNGCYLDYASEIRGCVLGNRVHVMHHVLISENTVVGDETVIKEYASIKANVLVWPRKMIDSHVSVDTSVVFTERHSSTLFGKNGLSGIINVDITPEFASRFGAAYGTYLGAESVVAVFWDGSPPSRLFRYAFIAGLLSTGLKVYDMKAMFLPVVRQTMPLLGVSGGIHIMVESDTTEKLQVLLLLPNGSNADKKFEKDVEVIYSKEDFLHASSNNIATVEGMPDVHESYSRHLMNLCNKELFMKKQPKIIISASSDALVSYLYHFFTSIGCQVVDSFVIDRCTPYFMLQENNMDDVLLCAWLDRNAESLYMMDKTGRVVYQELHRILSAYILYRTVPGINLLIPASSPSVVENLATHYTGTFTRVKNDEASLVRKLMEEDVFSTGYNQYQMQYDAIASLVFTIEFLISHNMTLTEALQNLPHWYLESRTVHCPWEMVGRVMHRLIITAQHGKVDTTDGIRYIFEKGWLHIFPDAEQPMLHLIAESYSARSTQEVLKQYTKLIEWMIDSMAYDGK